MKINFTDTKNSRLIIGVNSGTSMDALDVALVQINGTGVSVEMRLEKFESFPFPDGWKTYLLNLMHQGSTSQISQANVLIGKVFADGINRFIETHRIDHASVTAIGSHGQTIFHHPENEMLFNRAILSTLQLGDPSVIAQETGILTVGDLRMADIAAGGSGAPLVPYFDHAAFRDAKLTRGILNIGGIANITILKANGSLDGVMAFDTGPGNMLIDDAVQKFFNKPFDESGNIARTGKIREEILNAILQHEYFTLTPPKTTGRETFGQELAEKIFKKFSNIAPADLIATLTEVTARSIFDQVEKFSKQDLDELIVSGGGVKNGFLMERLKFYFKTVSIRTSDEFGIPAEAKEAMLFALLANECLMGTPANVPSVTGARKKVVVGKICRV
ncbi:anhydro-N-acetylmuramic acid kinase [bacterium]|nr:anhydro-N-acetylmuramic acid kinase [bacterium]